MPTPSGWVFLVLVGVALPLAAITSARRISRQGATPTRPRYFVSVAISQAVPTVLALSAARYEAVTLFPAPGFAPAGLIAAVIVLALALGTLPARWRWKPAAQRKRNLWLLPQKPSDLWWWAVVSLAAGICEEIVYRGVMFTLVDRMVGRWLVAAAICSLVFAIAHAVQGWRAVAVIFLFALGFHTIVRLSGDLYTAMAVHFVYDLLAGVVILRLARRDGLVHS